MCLLEPLPEGRERRPRDEAGKDDGDREGGITALQQLVGALRGRASDKPEGRPIGWQGVGGVEGAAPKGGGAAAKCIHGEGGGLV